MPLTTAFERVGGNLPDSSCRYHLSFAVETKIAVDRIVVEELFALGALRVVIIAARIANVDIVAVTIYSKGNCIGEEIIVAFRANQVFLVKTTGANISIVVYHGHLASIEVLLTMLAEAIIFIETTFANVNALAVAIENFPRLRAIIFAFLTKLATIVIAFITKKFGGQFARAGNAKTISANIENFKVMGVVLPDRNFGIKVRVNPIAITAKTTTASDVNVMFVAAIFFRLPQIWNALKLGKFALN